MIGTQINHQYLLATQWTLKNWTISCLWFFLLLTTGIYTSYSNLGLAWKNKSAIFVNFSSITFLIFFSSNFLLFLTFSGKSSILFTSQTKKNRLCTWDMNKRQIFKIYFFVGNSSACIKRFAMCLCTMGLGVGLKIFWGGWGSRKNTVDTKDEYLKSNVTLNYTQNEKIIFRKNIVLLSYFWGLQRLKHSDFLYIFLFWVKLTGWWTKPNFDRMYPTKWLCWKGRMPSITIMREQGPLLINWNFLWVTFVEEKKNCFLNSKLSKL